MLTHKSTFNLHPFKSLQTQLSPTKFNSSKTQLQKLYQPNTCKQNRNQFNLKFNQTHAQKQLFSDRKNRSCKKQPIAFGEASSKRLGSRFDRKNEDREQKSTMMSTLLSNKQERLKQAKQDEEKHLEGKCCKVVVVTNRQEETVHYIEVKVMGDITSRLQKEYPKYLYFKAIPHQLTLDYLLMQNQLAAAFLNGQTLYLKAYGTMTSSLTQKEEPMNLQKFEIIKVLGSGGFSKVFLCRFKEDGKFYAMKVIDKENIIKNKKKKIIANERNIMKESKHPFIIDMKFAFETEKHLIFILEYCPGGELFGLIKRYKRISEDMARFYIIEIFLGLSYLHQGKIIYRDIKPENILLGQDGHVKVADLGLAKPDMVDGELAYSFCGSPEYMSPEMIMQVGHTYPVDFYCMGALLYQLLIGLPPFYSRDTNEIYQAVLSEELDFPHQITITTQCKNLLRGLLCKDSKKRLGSIHGVKEILSHPWFGKNSYKTFLEKNITPPVTFDSVGRIDLDREVDQKHQKEVQEMLKAQKNENNHFKHVMKDFYYDYRGLTQCKSDHQFQKCISTDRKKQLRNSLKKNSLGHQSITLRKQSRQQSQKSLGRTLVNTTRK